jgi:hypothetical protein
MAILNLKILIVFAKYAAFGLVRGIKLKIEGWYMDWQN